jgi:hypothetical protein
MLDKDQWKIYELGVREGKQMALLRAKCRVQAVKLAWFQRAPDTALDVAKGLDTVLTFLEEQTDATP